MWNPSLEVTSPLLYWRIVDTVIQSVHPHSWHPVSGPVDALYRVLNLSICVMVAQFLFFSRKTARGLLILQTGLSRMSWKGSIGSGSAVPPLYSTRRFLSLLENFCFESFRPLYTSWTDWSCNRGLTAWASVSAGPATSTSCLRHTVSLLLSALISPGTVLHTSSLTAWIKGPFSSQYITLFYLFPI